MTTSEFAEPVTQYTRTRGGEVQQVRGHTRVRHTVNQKSRYQPNLKKECPACGHTPCEANPEGLGNTVVHRETKAYLREVAPGDETELYIGKYLSWKQRNDPPCLYS